MTTSQIFAANQILTVAKAKKLIGKKLLCTFPVYKGNQESVEEIVIKDVISNWDFANTKADGGHGTLQNYWSSYMTKEQIAKEKSKLVLITEEGAIPFYASNNGIFEELTFTCGDIDRPVFYVEAPTVHNA